jgi:hypothetical protein
MRSATIQPVPTSQGETVNIGPEGMYAHDPWPCARQDRPEAGNMTALLTALLSAAAAFVGAWFAAHFALRRFYRERIWERRAASYTAIFDAIHDLRNWFDKQAASEVHGVEMTDANRETLSAAYRAAGSALRRRADSETWLISDAFRSRLEVLEQDLAVRHTDWIDHIEGNLTALDGALNDLRTLARAELAVDRSWPFN